MAAGRQVNVCRFRLVCVLREIPKIVDAVDHHRVLLDDARENLRVDEADHGRTGNTSSSLGTGHDAPLRAS